MQYRTFNFEDDDSTDDLNRQHLAAIPGGLYRGYDYSVANTTALSLGLVHTITGYREVSKDLSLSPYLGMVRTWQGSNIYEDAPILVPVVSNAANANPRIDLVLLEHEYVEVAGGGDAGYVVIQGTPSVTPVAPALTFPEKQVLIGTIYWPGLATGLLANNVVYTRATPPKFNDDVASILVTGWQVITGRKTFQHQTSITNALAYDGGTKILTAAADSNHYTLANTSGGHIEVLAISLPFSTLPFTANEVTVFSLYTLQRIKFVSGGNIDLPGGAVIHVEVGETVTFRTVAGITPVYTLEHGAEPKRDKPAKFYGQLIANAGVASMNVATGLVTIDFKGNYYELSYDFNATNLDGIIGSDLFGDAALPLTKYGSRVCIKCINTGAPGTGIISSESNPAVGKGIVNFMGINSPLYNGDYLLLQEQAANYVLLEQVGTTLNLQALYNAYHARDQIEEKVYNKAVSTGWKTLPYANFNIADGVLSITNDGNSFLALIPTADIGGYLTDIKIIRAGAGAVACPDGMIINIKFQHNVYIPGISEPFLIDTSAGSNIASSIDDSLIATGGSAGSLHISSPTYPLSDIFTFRKSNGKWEIIGMAPQASLYARIKQLELSPLESWRVVGSTGQPPFGVAYSTYALAPPRFRRNKNLITLSGAVTLNGGWGSGNTVFTLPTGYRPSVDEQTLSSDNTGIDGAVVFVGANGDVKIYSTNAIAGRRVFLSFISFYTD